MSKKEAMLIRCGMAKAVPRVQSASLLLLGLLLAAILAAPVQGAETSPDTLRAQIDKDQMALADLVKRVNNSPTNQRTEVSALADALTSRAATFDASVTTYRGMAFGDPDLNEAHRLATSAVISVAGGSRQAAG